METIRHILDKTITTNIDLSNLLDYLGIPHWIGMRDEFNSDVLSRHQFFILNIQPRNMTGQHWTALYRRITPDNKSQCIFFDSYGSSPMKEVVDTCRRLKIPLSYSNNMYQHFESENCGFFAVAFLLCMAKGLPFKSFGNLFSDKEERNDRIVKRLITKELIKIQNKNN